MQQFLLSPHKVQIIANAYYLAVLILKFKIFENNLDQMSLANSFQNQFAVKLFGMEPCCKGHTIYLFNILPFSKNWAFINNDNQSIRLIFYSQS